MNVSDERTRNLFNGLNLLLNLFPNGRLRLGYSERELHFRTTDDIELSLISEENKRLLDDWCWSLEYYEDKYFWEYYWEY